jgi:hypothetical protein
MLINIKHYLLIKGIIVVAILLSILKVGCAEGVSVETHRLKAFMHSNALKWILYLLF